MSEDLKSKCNFVFQVIKSSVLGVVVSIVMVLILAFVLKFVELNDTTITIIDEIIKIISIFVATLNLINHCPYRILPKGALVGAIYTVLTFVVFSSLRGTFNFGASLIVDILLGALVGVIVAVILNIFKKEKVQA